MENAKGGRFDELLRTLLWEGKIDTSATNVAEATEERVEEEGEGETKPSATKLEILRSKAYLRTKDGRCWILQGVRDIYEVTEIPSDRRGIGKDEKEIEIETKLVLIGRGLDSRLKDDFLLALGGRS